MSPGRSPGRSLSDALVTYSLAISARSLAIEPSIVRHPFGRRQTKAGRAARSSSATGSSQGTAIARCGARRRQALDRAQPLHGDLSPPLQEDPASQR